MTLSGCARTCCSTVRAAACCCAVALPCCCAGVSKRPHDPQDVLCAGPACGVCWALCSARGPRCVSLQAVEGRLGLLLKQLRELLAGEVGQQLPGQLQDDVWAGTGEVLQRLFDVSAAVGGCRPAQRVAWKGTARHSTCLVMLLADQGRLLAGHVGYMCKYQWGTHAL